MFLWEELNEKREDLDKSIKNLRHSGSDYASAYREYRIALRKELLKLREEGVPVTLAYDIARGIEYVADLKKEEIEYEAIYKANIEAISSIRLEIKVLENQISREWGNN